MVMRFRGVDIQTKNIGGKTMIDFRMFLFVCCNFGSVSVSREASFLPKNSFVKVKNTMNTKKIDYFVDGVGISDFLQRSQRLDKTEKHIILNSLKYLKMVDDNIIIFSNRKELDFKSDLLEVLTPIGINVKYQFGIPDVGIVDFLIGNVAIEYDEQSHDNYNKEFQEKRSKGIIDNGYDLLRLNANNSNLHNIGLVINSIKKELL